MKILARLVTAASAGTEPLANTDVRVMRVRYSERFGQAPKLHPIAKGQTDPDGRVSLTAEPLRDAVVLQVRHKRSFVSLVPGVPRPDGVDFGEVWVVETPRETVFDVALYGAPVDGLQAPRNAPPGEAHFFEGPLSLEAARAFLAPKGPTMRSCWPRPPTAWLHEAAGLGAPLQWKSRRVGPHVWVDEDVRLTNLSPDDPNPMERDRFRIDLRMRVRRPGTELAVLTQLPPRNPTLVLRGFDSVERAKNLERFRAALPALELVSRQPHHLQPHDFGGRPAKPKRRRSKRKPKPTHPSEPTPPVPMNPPPSPSGPPADACPRCKGHVRTEVVRVFRDPHNDAWADDQIWRCDACHWRQRKPHAHSEQQVSPPTRGDADLGDGLRGWIANARKRRTAKRSWTELGRDLVALLNDELAIDQALAQRGSRRRRQLTQDEMHALTRLFRELPATYKGEVREHWNKTVKRHFAEGWPQPEVLEFVLANPRFDASVSADRRPRCRDCWVATEVLSRRLEPCGVSVPNPIGLRDQRVTETRCPTCGQHSVIREDA